jgi:hypothetical protein
MRDQRAVDRQHLQLLAIFHYVVAALALLGIGFLFVHYTLMSSVFNNPQMWQGKNGHGEGPPREFFALFKWFYVIMGVMLILAALGNLLSAIFIQQRKNRMFSLVVAGLDCLQIPFGTVLGVFTIIVLIRESVMELYEHTNDPV